tara:strand:+ start:1183 stop:1446 length:264 start_codon:yes stop_codon:yes gene_type:complete
MKDDKGFNKFAQEQMLEVVHNKVMASTCFEALRDIVHAKKSERDNKIEEVRTFVELFEIMGSMGVDARMDFFRQQYAKKVKKDACCD